MTSSKFNVAGNLTQRRKAAKKNKCVSASAKWRISRCRRRPQRMESYALGVLATLREAFCSIPVSFPTRGSLIVAFFCLCLVPFGVAAEVAGGPPRIRNVYIPSDELKLLFADATQGVLMPRDEILALWLEAENQSRAQTVETADAVLAQATYEARLDDDELRLIGRVQLVKLRDGWEAIDLPCGGLAIDSARLAGKPAQFGRKEDGTLFLLLEQKGRAELELEMSVPLASQGGDTVATLRLPPVTASEIRLRLDEIKQLQVGENVLHPESSVQGEQVFRVSVGRTGLVPLVISDRLSGGNRAPLVFARSRSTARIEPAGLRWQVDLDLEVYARATDSFQLQLPVSVDIAGIEAAQLAQWTAQEQDGSNQVVTLHFRKAFLGGRAVRLLGLAPISVDVPWDVPTVKVLQAASHVGRVCVVASPTLRVETLDSHGIQADREASSTQEAADDRPSAAAAPPLASSSGPIVSSPPEQVGQFGSNIVIGSGATGSASVDRRLDEPEKTGANPSKLAEPVAPRAVIHDISDAGFNKPTVFAFWDEDFQLTLRVSPRRRTLQASIASLIEVGESEVRFRSSMTVAPRHAPLFDVQLQFPSEWEVTSVLSGKQAVEWDSVVRAGADPAADVRWQVIRFDLGQPLRPGQSLEIELAARQVPTGWLDEAQSVSEVSLPDLQLSGADAVEGTLLIETPADVEALTADLPAELEPVAADRSPGTSGQASGTTLQFRYRDDARVSGRLQLRKKPVKVSADTLAFVRLDRGKLDVHYQLDLHIERGRLRQIAFALPQSAGNKLNVVPVDSSARVSEQQYTPRENGIDARAGEYLWQIVLDRPVSGALTLAVDFGQTVSHEDAAQGTSEPAEREADRRETNRPVPIPVLTLQDAFRQSGIVAVEAAADQQIAFDPEYLRELDPADVPGPKAYIPTQRIVAAYQYPRLPYRLSISATRYASEAVLNAICESAEILSVAGREGRMQHQARFRLRSVTLQHLPLTLPENAELWSVLLDREPVEVRSKQGVFLVPLPAGEAETPDRSRELTLYYETQAPFSSLDAAEARLRPQEVRQRAPEIGLTTLATTWQVYPPQGTEVISSAGDFAPVTRLTRPTSLSRLASSIATEVTSGLGWKSGSLVVVLVVAGIIALCHRGGAWAINLPQLLVVLLVTGMLIALLLPATQSAREAARRMQCNNNLKQIGLALHNYHDVYGQFPPAAIGPHNVPRERQFSWLVAILPFIEQQMLYDELRLDLPWDHPLNAALLHIPFPVLFCPSDVAAATTQEGFPRTSYVAVTGADVTDGTGDLRGIIGFDRGLALPEISDGAASTLIVAEVTDGGPWFAAGSGTARRIDHWITNKAWSNHSGGGDFLLADGSVRFLPSGIEPQTLRHLATAQGQDHVVDAEFGEFVAPAATAATVDDQAEVAKEMEERAAEVAAPPATAQTAPPPKVPPSQPMQRGQRARLSLQLALDLPKEEAIRFHRDGGPGELVLGLQDRAFARTIQWLICAAMLLAAWLGRRASGRRRAIAVVLGLALSVGLAGLTPLALTPLLDGLALGSIAAAGLWLVRAALEAIQRQGLAVVGVALVVTGLLYAADASSAQETQPTDKPEAANRVEGRRDLTLYIPYEPNGEDPLRGSRVYLPHDEFLRLWKRAHPEAASVPPQGVAAFISYAEYIGRLRDDVAHFDGRLVLHHAADQWAQVPLPLGDVALEEVEINGQPATLLGVPPAVSLQQSGLHVVDLHFSVPVSRLGATGRMAIALQPVASGRLLFRLPAPDLEVQVSGAAGGWRREAKADSPTTDPGEASDSESTGDWVSIPLGAADELSIRWQPRKAAASAEQLVSVDQALRVALLDSGVHLHSTFHYRIRQGAVSRVELQVPADVLVQAVQGPEVADWSLDSDTADDAPDTRKLVVSLKKESSTNVEVNVDYFRRDRAVAGTVSVHALEPLGVVRETGELVVVGFPNLRVRVESSNRLEQIELQGLALARDAQAEGVPLLAYRYNSRPWELRLQVERIQTRVEVFERSAISVSAREATLRSLLAAEVIGAPVVSLRFRLPDSLRISQIQVPAGAEWFVERDDAGQQLTVQLREPATGKLELGVSGALTRVPSETEFLVPRITAEAVDVQRGELAISLDDDLSALLMGSNSALPIDPAELDGALRAAKGRRVQYAFRYESPPEVRLRLSPASARLSADVTTVVSVREGAVAYISQVDFEIRQAGCSRFRITTPDWLGDDVELRGERIRQIRSQLSNTVRTWEIELQQPQRNAYRVQLTQNLPAPPAGTLAAPLIRPLDVERSRGYVVLENLTADEVAPSTLRGVTTISPAELPPGLTETVRRQAVAAYRVADEAAGLVWQRQLREQEAGLAASINLADLTTVLHADGRYRARAAYHIRNFRLQFLELELPADSRVWSVLVAGQPVRPARVVRADRTVTLLPLQKTSAGDFSAKVIINYAGHVGRPLGRWTRVSPPAPRILGDVPVSRTLWTLLLPREYQISLVNNGSNVDQVAVAYHREERQLSFLDELRQMVQVASISSKSGAGIKAWDNLQQADSALQSYKEQALFDAIKTRVVQEQAQQIEAEIQRLHSLKKDLDVIVDDARRYFVPPPERTQGDEDLQPEDRAGLGREQLMEQLERLQMPRGETGLPQPAEPRRESVLPQEQADQPAAEAATAIEDRVGEQAAGDQRKATTGEVEAAHNGYLSLDLDLSLVGTPYHFRKLHGDPRLVVAVQHEDLRYYFSAFVWAIVCAAMAAVAIFSLRKTETLARALHNWPWLAALAGLAWLFLLPGGAFGLVPIFIALWALTARSGKPASSVSAP